MKRRVWVSALLTVVAVAAYFQLLISPQPPGVALNINPQGKANYVISSVPGLPLPDGLHKGDILEMHRMPPSTRAALLLGQPITAGTRLDIVVRRGDRLLSVPVTSQYLPNSFASRYSNLLRLRNGLLLVILALGILSIWRGRNLAATGLGVFAFAIIISADLNSIAVAPAWAFWMQMLSSIVLAPLIFIGLFLMAYALSKSSLRAPIKKGLTGAFVLTCALLISLALTELLGKVYFFSRGLPVLVLPIVACGLALITLLMLVWGYTQSGPEQRLRIRWILCSTGILFLGLISQGLTVTTNDITYQLVWDYITVLLLIIAVSGYTYAVLRLRLVDVRVVINRTLVYAVITALVVGIFAAISTFTERATLGQGASLLLELIVPLALGIVLSTLRKYIDKYVSRFLFHRKYAAEKALNDFARTCDFIEQPERLLDQAIQQIFKHTHAVSVALYERDAHDYRCARQQGSVELPVHVDVDDLAFTRLRAGDHEIDLHTTESALGMEGYAFPMSVRGRLIGALVCGPRPAEQYTVEERELLAHVARQVGAAIHALRSLEHEKFVDSVANGSLDAANAREQARRLLNIWQTA